MPTTDPASTPSGTGAPPRAAAGLLAGPAARRGALCYVAAVAAFGLTAVGPVSGAIEQSLGLAGAGSLSVLLAVALVGLAVCNAGAALLLLGGLLVLVVRAAGRAATWSLGCTAVAGSLWPLSAALAVGTVAAVLQGTPWVLQWALLDLVMAGAVVGHVVLVGRRVAAWGLRARGCLGVCAAYVAVPAVLLLGSSSAAGA